MYFVVRKNFLLVDIVCLPPDVDESSIIYYAWHPNCILNVSIRFIIFITSCVKNAKRSITLSNFVYNVYYFIMIFIGYVIWRWVKLPLKENLFRKAVTQYTELELCILLCYIHHNKFIFKQICQNIFTAP